MLGMRIDEEERDQPCMFYHLTKQREGRKDYLGGVVDVEVAFF